MLKRALEGAGFISAYDRSAHRAARSACGRPTTLDETAARELAVKQGLGVVLSGSIEPQGNGYAISVKATQAVTGNVIANARGQGGRARTQVLGAATKLVDDGAQGARRRRRRSRHQLFAMASLSATSLDVVRDYAGGAWRPRRNSKFEEARQTLLKAVELDPKFGIGYQLLAVASRNLGKLQDAEKYIKEALRHLDGMTERERYARAACSTGSPATTSSA